MTRIRHPLLALVGALSALAAGPVLAQATITIVNNDAAGEGFNDPTPVAPVAGNAGTTLGQQRLIAFQAAADEWEGVVTSGVEIRIDAALDPLTPCTATSGILGRAGTNQVFRDFSGAPLPNTWYSGALANAISGTDNGPGTDDIQARFNSSVDNATCLGPTSWFYGIGVATPAGSISFFDTVKHELGHGLGVQSFVDIVTTGQLFNGRNDAFTNMLHDHGAGAGWPTMTDAERLASAADTGDLHWVGARVNECAAQILTGGMAGGHVQMFAPATIQPGSSVSHFDTAVVPDELMEPFATATSDQRLTDRLLADLGWDVTSPSCGGFVIPHGVALSAQHFPVGSFHRPIFSAFPHGVVLSTQHVPAGSIHFPAGSVQHEFIQSAVGPHNAFLSQGHSIIRSQGHLEILSRPQHSFVGSRFEPFDPREPILDPTLPGLDPRFPGFDPRVAPFGGMMGGGQMGGAAMPATPHNMIVSFGHSPSTSFSGHAINLSGGHRPLQSTFSHASDLSFGHHPGFSFGHDQLASGQGAGPPPAPHHPLVSGGGHQPFASFHDPFRSGGHDAFTSTGHDPFLSTGHSPFLSSHDPLFSFHDPFLSNGHTAGFSFHHPIVSGHVPAISVHSPVLSNPHQRVLSRLHQVVPSNFDEGPVFDPLRQGGAMPTDPSGGMAPEGALDPLPEGLERVPGNRAGVAYPGIMPGDPYAPPQ